MSFDSFETTRFKYKLKAEKKKKFMKPNSGHFILFEEGATFTVATIYMYMYSKKKKMSVK